MIQQTSTKSPATEALRKALICLNSNTASVSRSEKPTMIKTQSLKRPFSCSSTTFDMSAFADASQHVEESIAFPSIEWNFDIGCEEDDEELVSPPPAKRRCHGLARALPPVPDLTSLL